MQRAHVLVALSISLCACSDLQRLLTDAAQNPHSGSGSGGHHSPPPTGDAGPGPVEPEPEPVTCGTVIGVDELYADVRADLNRLDRGERRFARYVTLAQQFNAGLCGAELDVGRLALREVLNGTSSSPVLVQAVAIDDRALTYRFDLRSPGWNRALRVSGVDFDDGWEAVIAASPFAVEHTGPDAARVQAATGTSVPLFALDAFVDVATKNELYYALVGVPASSAALFAELGVDTVASVANGSARRAVTANSRISRQDRILERYPLGVRPGFLWSAQDFLAGGSGAFEQPLDAIGDARAVLYSLPNALSAFALFDGAGTRVDSSDVLMDTTQNDFRARTAQSCLNCHAAGVIPFADELRPQVDAHPDRYSAEVVAAVQRLYPTSDELASVLAADARAQHDAQTRAGLPTSQGSQAFQVSMRFAEGLGLAELAGELLVSREELLARLPELPPVLQRQPVERGAFAEVFQAGACRLQTGRNRPRRCD